MPQGKRPSDPSQRVPQPGGATPAPKFQGPGQYAVKLPGGGMLDLSSADEVMMWNEASKRYISDYAISKQNDLILLGALLSQVLMMYRAQKELAVPEKAAAAQAMISKTSDDIRKAEKALGIDKATREKGGQHTVAEYVSRLKRAAYEKGVHLSKRLKAYEDMAMEMRWKIRLLRNGDDEDRRYHNLSEKSIVDELERTLASLEELDKQFAKEKGAIFVGKL